MPRFSKACSFSSDCVPVEHIADCCGSKVVWGIAKSEQSAFAAAETECKTFRPLCNCPAQMPKLEDGNSYYKSSSIRVVCLAGVCRTEHRCGGLCSSGEQCFRCGSAGYCAASCTIGPWMCKKFELCIASTDNEQFCAPQGTSSCP